MLAIASGELLTSGEASEEQDPPYQRIRKCWDWRVMIGTIIVLGY
jgi:hypothetical protein